jgi:hypothetical protein
MFANLASAQKGEFLTTEDFHQIAFPNSDIKWNALWLTKDSRAKASEILGRKAKGLRVRYWGEASKTAWILEEIGKELPITVGIIVEDAKIAQIEILTYRESRGGEVRYPFFTKQFKKLTAKAPEWKLDKKIDGITGATLSVIALEKLARLALYYDSLAQHQVLASNS